MSTRYGLFQVPAAHIVAIHVVNPRHSLRQRVEVVLAHCNVQGVQVEVHEPGTVVICTEDERVRRLVAGIPGVSAIGECPKVKPVPPKKVPNGVFE